MTVVQLYLQGHEPFRRIRMQQILGILTAELTLETQGEQETKESQVSPATQFHGPV